MKMICVFLLSMWVGHTMAQQGNIPVVVKPVAGSTKPLVLYITGDGGMKKFSVNVTDILQQQHYPVLALNALKYFWNKKSPQQAAGDMAGLITKYQHTGQPVVLIGYSLGADVMPFIYSHLPASLQVQVQRIVLLSPSLYTDLEVHVSDMLGKGGRKGMSVPAAINEISGKPLLLIFGAQEKDFDLTLLKVPYQRVVLPGGHAYDEDANGVASRIIHFLESEKE